ncbi:adenylate/guanylate cyclase domain-containing protein [Gordonia sp. TBRC 11910]|uniref:Adenylate/guanylate cyclase domain-containing protein n=1 Tax=Gordonia asplenii TaxID=2725283 RepID=A0A848KQF2_9ACTN|nr:adenylate/guanylate cyclase domain-containing protein [Gordonia asplenii]
MSRSRGGRRNDNVGVRFDTERAGRLVRTIRRSPGRYREFDAAGLLDGLDAAGRVRRFVQLSRLVDSGIGTDRLIDAANEGRLAHLVMRDALIQRPRYTLEEVAAKSGVSVTDVERWFRAMGRGVSSRVNPDYNDADLQLAHVLVEYRELGLLEKELFAAARVLGRHLWAVADAVEVLVELRLSVVGDNSDVAVRMAAEVRRLAVLQSNIVEHLMATRLEASTLATDHGAGPRHELAVGFADLVGFTRLGELTEPTVLAELAEQLDRLTTETVEAPVRFVKTVGDAVMVISPDAEAIADMFRRLFAAAADEGLPPLHAGIAWGPALPRAGDWIGRTVNLAARVSAVATRGTILVDQDMHERLDATRFPQEEAGTFDLKGYDGARQLYRLVR